MNITKKQGSENKRLEEKLVHSLEALQAVYNIATTLRGSYESLCDEIVLNLAKFLKVASVSIQHIENEHVRVISRVTGGVLFHDETFSFKDSACLIEPGRKKPYQKKPANYGTDPIYLSPIPALKR